MKPTVLGEPTYYIPIRPYKDVIDTENPIVQRVHSRFEVANLANMSKPFVMGVVYDTAKFSYPNNFPDGLSVIDLNINAPFGGTYRIPKELDQFSETIARIVSHEHKINPYHPQYYAYLTVIQSVVHSGKFQRTTGLVGVDDLHPGMNKRPLARSYTVCDRVPDIFYCQKFDLSGVNWMHECKESQQKPGVLYHGLYGDIGKLPELLTNQAVEKSAVGFEQYSIVVNDIYSAYRETTVDYPFFRTFFKLTFDTINRKDNVTTTASFDRN